MYLTSKTTVPFNKTYDDDISEQLCRKSEDDIKQWMHHTDRMIERLVMSPDPSKGDPKVLVAKLANRVEQMKAHMKKRGKIFKQPISTGSEQKRRNPFSAMPQNETKSTVTTSTTGTNGSAESSPRSDVWAYAAPPLFAVTPPPTLHGEENSFCFNEGGD
jgi:hypothetical protein